MKAIFPLLLIYVFMTVQTYAISGGPNFSGGSFTIVSGLYSGVLQGTTEVTGTAGPAIPGDPTAGNTTDGGTSSNALGLFAMTVPVIGLATGTFMLFADGVVFGGTIDASADPDSAQIKGIIQGTFAFSLNTFDATGAAVSTAITASALGKITAQVRNSSGPTRLSLARLTGTADLGVNFGQVDASTFAPIVVRTINFDVIGFKQQNLATS
jgi:hypothetical protein